jgi:uncharacterized protein HemY
MREKAGDCFSYFTSLVGANSQHPNADYALGRYFMLHGKLKEAQPHLEKALKLATAEPRKRAIKGWLIEIQASKGTVVQG